MDAVEVYRVAIQTAGATENGWKILCEHEAKWNFGSEQNYIDAAKEIRDRAARHSVNLDLALVRGFLLDEGPSAKVYGGVSSASGVRCTTIKELKTKNENHFNMVILGSIAFGENDYALTFVKESQGPRGFGKGYYLLFRKTGRSWKLVDKWPGTTRY